MSKLIPVQATTSVELRAKALKAVRHFFDQRGSLEVDAPTLSPYPDCSAFIDPFETTNGLFLHTSPEYAMKRILAKFPHDIYFLGHVFRKEEEGKNHSSEFTMIEWYKIKTNEEIFLREILDLFALFLGPLTCKRFDYSEAFALYATPLASSPKGWTEQEIRHYQWATQVEPSFGSDEITLVTNFPAEDAALSKLHVVNGISVAKRYEFYYKGIELGNGFYELTDPLEQRERFERENLLRIQMGKAPLKADPLLLEAIAHLPEETYGVAVGFDRLLMLSQKAESLLSIKPL